MRILTLVLIFSFCLSCSNEKGKTYETRPTPPIREVKVVAHRGDWRNAPENSLDAILRCLELDIEIVEVDLGLTKDSVFVIMHDEFVNRTTTGNGRVSEYTLREIRNLRLKDGLGMPTSHKVPTLDEVLEAIEGEEIILNLDKSYEYINRIYSILKKRNQLEKVIFKGWMKDYFTVMHDLNFDLSEVDFMPILDLRQDGWENILLSYSEYEGKLKFEVIFDSDVKFLKAQALIDKMNGDTWVNTLWPGLCAGHDDERAINDLESTYGWLVTNGVDLMQTDRPKMMHEFLKNRSLVN